MRVEQNKRRKTIKDIMLVNKNYKSMNSNSEEEFNINTITATSE